MLWLQQVTFSFHVKISKMKFPWNLLEVDADQGRAHRFAQSFYHLFVSEQKYDTRTKQHVPN